VLRLDGYDPPKLVSFEAYWMGAKGLADFSSLNFFSAGTNLTLLGGGLCGGLIDPPCSSLAYESPLERREVFSTRGPRAGLVQVFYRRMMDPVTGEPLRAAVTSRSFWDQHLEERGHLPVFSLNTINYDSKADILIPRAVAYSAGLLNRFFRASVAASMDDDQRFIFHNLSPDEALSGTFFVLHENPDGVREPLAFFVLSLPPEGQSDVLPVRKLPRNPPEGTRCWVVFRGTLGEEPNVVAGSLTSCPVEPPEDPPPPGPEWTVYSCRLIPFSTQPGGAHPDTWVHYTYATQSPARNIDGFPVSQFSRFEAKGTTDCARGGSGPMPEGGWPPHVRLELL
jgi:hypothetical protein